MSPADLTKALLAAVEDAGDDAGLLLALVGAMDIAKRQALRAVANLLVQPAKPSHPRFVSVAAACTTYPLSRSFLYAHGEEEGILVRPSGRKLVVDVDALERWLRRSRG